MVDAIGGISADSSVVTAYYLTCSRLPEHLPGQFCTMVQMEEYVDLLPYNTFHIAWTARYFVRVQCPNQLEALVHSPIFQTRPHFVLGGGSKYSTHQ